MKYFKYFDLNIASVISIIFFLVLLLWWAFLQYLGITNSPLNYLFALFYGILPLLGGFYTLIKSIKLKDSINKTVFYLSLGLIAWGVGEIIWSYYNFILNIEVPYPSVADLAYILSYPLWFVALIYLAKSVGLELSLKSRFIKTIFFVFSFVIVLVAVYLVLFRGSLDYTNLSGDYTKLFFDISYPVWDVILLVLALIINVLSLGTIRGKLSAAVTIITVSLMFYFLADLGFTYQSTVNTFFNGNYIDLFYMITVSLITIAACLLTSDGEALLLSSQSVLLKQREEELKEANIKLHDRDELLSRINQELYKKNLELIEEKRRSEALLYNVNEAVLVLDNDEKILLFNRAASDLIGPREEEVTGKGFDEVVNVVNEKSAQITSAIIKESLGYRQGSKMSNLTLKRSDSKERYVNLTASKVLIDKDMSVYVLIISDVTEEKRAEKAREEFISIASHELRTPMTIIKNYLWMLQNKKGGDLTPKQGEYVEKATAGTERMIKLIHDMLDISRMEQGRMEFHPTQVSIASLIGEIASDFKIKADQKGMKLSLKIEDNLPKVRADEDKLREVIVNLIGNSLKYTDTGFVNVEALTEGKNVKVSITDSGRGISKDDIPKLFNKFGRLDNSFVTAAESGGTGLGLYIVKSIVEAMGGKVGVSSEGVGKGSTFWFTVRMVE